MFDSVIVGSGPAGTAAAMRLAGRRTLVLDVGERPERLPGAGAGSFRNADASASASDELILGSRFESLHNIHRDYLSPKLKSPLMRYVTRGWPAHTPIVSSQFQPMLSLAQGGLANAWGAGAYRFRASELQAFPIRSEELDPYYDILTAHIGISGAADDLEDHFGPATGLLPPMRLGPVGIDMLAHYKRRRSAFRSAGVTLGLPRCAILTTPHNGRPPYTYDGMEFFFPHREAVYNPAFTLRDLVARGGIEYRDGHLVTEFEEVDDGVEVRGRNLKTGENFAVRARTLVLGAGAINSARLVLQSRRDLKTALPLRDNEISYVPLVNVRRLGAAPATEFVPLQLNMVYDGPLAGAPVQGSIYGVEATLYTDYLFDFPLAVRDLFTALRFAVPALNIIQLFYADVGAPRGHMRLKGDAVQIDYPATRHGAVERELIRLFFRCGYVSHPALCKYPAPGNSFHYASTLPMTETPGPYETFPTGRLQGTTRIYVADASSFTELPAKNLTLSIMANSMRIADGVLRFLESES